MDFDAALARKPKKEVYMTKSDSTQLSRWAKDEVGNVYGKLTVVRFSHVEKQAHWVCLCECGNEKVVNGKHLRDKKGTRSCGCLRKRAGGLHGTQEHNSWSGMRSRCYNRNGYEYHLYGGRGITVCDRWNESFLNFLEDMGKKPSEDSSVDRIDVNGNYEPSNCRWATPMEQGQNTRKVKLITHNGETMSINAWARKLGIPGCTLWSRISSGMPVEDAFKPPKQKEKYYTLNGKTMCISDWARHAGIHCGTVESRLRRGWSIEKAVATPVQQQRGHNCPLESPDVP